MRRVLAISSGGGHWIELLRVRPALSGQDIAYATVSRIYAAQVPGARFHVIPDTTRWSRLAALRCVISVARVLLRERPHAVISTGALPGLIGIALGKLMGCRTIWLDSIANVEELSMSGRAAGLFADLWLTQWPELAARRGPRFAGAIV